MEADSRSRIVLLKCSCAEIRLWGVWGYLYSAFVYDKGESQDADHQRFAGNQLGIDSISGIYSNPALQWNKGKRQFEIFILCLLPSAFAVFIRSVEGLIFIGIVLSETSMEEW